LLCAVQAQDYPGVKWSIGLRLHGTTDKNVEKALKDKKLVGNLIDLKREEEAKVRAEKLKEEKVSMDSEEFARVAEAIQKESARIRVAKKHYTKRGMGLGE